MIQSLIVNYKYLVTSCTGMTETGEVVELLFTFSNLFTCELILCGGPYHLELLCVSLFSVLNHSRFCIALFYRPPSHSVSVFDNLCETLQLIDPARFSYFILVGDFNVDFSDHDNYLHSRITSICTLSL